MFQSCLVSFDYVLLISHWTCYSFHDCYRNLFYFHSSILSKFLLPNLSFATFQMVNSFLLLNMYWIERCKLSCGDWSWILKLACPRTKQAHSMIWMAYRKINPTNIFVPKKCWPHVKIRMNRNFSLWKGGDSQYV